MISEKPYEELLQIDHFRSISNDQYNYLRISINTIFNKTNSEKSLISIELKRSIILIDIGSI